jgi:hypothetical protein
VIGAITVRTESVTVADPAVDAVTNTARVQRNCQGTERAISAGTSWGDDGNDLNLVTQEIEPILTQNVVTGYVAVGGNNTGESSNFTLHVLCYTP